MIYFHKYHCSTTFPVSQGLEAKIGYICLVCVHGFFPLLPVQFAAKHFVMIKVPCVLWLNFSQLDNDTWPLKICTFCLF